MRPHGGYFLLLCLIVGLAGLGLLLFWSGTDSAAAELSPPAPASQDPGAVVAPPAPPGALTNADGAVRRHEPVAVVEAAESAKRTDGMIRGDVTLAASAVDRIQAVTIRIVEAVGDGGISRGRKPFISQHTLPFDPKDGTPKFSFDDIPFSDVGYVVQACVPGLNGTEQMVQLNEQHPIADVVLGVHPGTPFSVLLRDQDMTPLVGVQVTLTPEGAPHGRPAYHKVSDGFGAAMFEDVLRGTYQAHIGPMGQPLLPSQPVEVLASSGLSAQSKTIVVAKGESLVVNLLSPLGHGVADVEVKLSSGSDVRYREMKQKTDWSGRATFEHLAPGSYWVNVIDPRYEPRTVPASVRAGEKPKGVDIRLLMR